MKTASLKVITSWAFQHNHLWQKHKQLAMELHSDIECIHNTASGPSWLKYQRCVDEYTRTSMHLIIIKQQDPDQWLQ